MQESAGYPSSTATLSKEISAKLLDLPCGNCPRIDLLWLKENVWKDVTEFEVPESEFILGMQANIFKIVLKNTETTEEFRVVGKRVVPSELPAKANIELWQDFLDSVQREVDFYREKSCDNPELFPQVFYSDGFQDRANIMESTYLILLKDVSDSYFQDTGMKATQAENLMRALAKFHATHWRKSLDSVRGTFWVLSRRKPLGEVENADKNWKAILERFPHFANLAPGIEHLALDLAAKADKLDHFVSSNLLTQVHGDCKGWNLFFVRKECQTKDASPTLFIDLQWTGIGHPLQDVAYSLTTSLNPEELNKMDHFLNLYIQALKSQIQDPIIDEFHKHFDLIWLDYARVILTGLWKRLSPEYLAQNKNKVGPSYIGRSLEHAEFIIKKVHHLLHVKNII